MEANSSDLNISSELFATDENSVSSTESEDCTEFSTLDECLNYSYAQENLPTMPIRTMLRGQPQQKKIKTKHLVPITFV